MLRQRPYPQTLGRMMAGGDIGNPRFSRQMHRMFRNLAGKKRIDTQQSGLLELALTTAGAPGHALNPSISVTDHQGRTM